jgi:hypothetical protein
MGIGEEAYFRHFKDMSFRTRARNLGDYAATTVEGKIIINGEVINILDPEIKIYFSDGQIASVPINILQEMVNDYHRENANLKAVITSF